MAEAIVSFILEQVSSILVQQMEQNLRLVVDGEKELEQLTCSLKAIQAVLDDAEKRQVKEATIRHWLDQLKNVSYDVEDVLDEWNTTILRSKFDKQDIKLEKGSVRNKVRSLFPSHCSCFSRLVLRHDIGQRIKKLNSRLNVIANERSRYNFELGTKTEELERQITASVIDISEIQGRDQDKKRLMSMLLGESSEGPTFHIISILGMGGLGKTTLAQLVYNTHEVKSHFDQKIWVCVSDPFNEIRIAKAIVEALTGSSPVVTEFETLLQTICKLVTGKKFFLLLDDVWAEDYRKWEPLKNSLRCASSGSKVLVTTRKDTVTKMMGTTHKFLLGELNREECWLLFSQVAFFGRSKREREDLEDIGRQIVEKCKGLPLAAKVLGGLMRFKESREEWQDVLESGIWKLEGAEEFLIPPLLLSYFDLPPAVRRCFSYCAIFPKDYKIDQDNLIKLWMSQGYLKSMQNSEMEAIGRQYFKNLAARSFFQNFEKAADGRILRCMMHDIVHDLTQFLARKECVVMGVNTYEEHKSNCRHLNLGLKQNPCFPSPDHNISKLRTVMFESPNFFSYDKTCLSILFRHLTYLRALNLCQSNFILFGGNSIEELPEEVGNLVHLRYLNISRNTKLKKLPEAIGNLFNLQTLNIDECIGLEALPLATGKLINLRHLMNGGTYGIHFIPREIGKLKHLRTLTEFRARGEGDDSEIFTLRDLNQLDNLRGFLSIRGLGDMTDVCDARKAKLNLKDLDALQLDFDGDKADGLTNELHLENLQPPSNLGSLKISYYIGATMCPSWLMSLTKLSVVELHMFDNVEKLPPLGTLPSLESVALGYFRKVKRVGDEFLGPEAKYPPISSSFIAFPKLTTLEFYSMEEWEEWDYGHATENSKIIIMPILQKLKLQVCPKLKTLPDLGALPLKQFDIGWCPSLDEAEDLSKIYHTSHLQLSSINRKRRLYCEKGKGNTRILPMDKISNLVES